MVSISCWGGYLEVEIFDRGCCTILGGVSISCWDGYLEVEIFDGVFC